MISKEQDINEYADTNMTQALNDYANDVGIKEEYKYEMTYSRY